MGKKSKHDLLTALVAAEWRVVSAENISGLCGQEKHTAVVPIAPAGMGTSKGLRPVVSKPALWSPVQHLKQC